MLPPGDGNRIAADPYRTAQRPNDTLPGLTAIALSADGSVALLGKGTLLSGDTELYVDGRLTSFSSVPHAFGMSHNGRFVVGSVPGTSDEVIYDRATGQSHRPARSSERVGPSVEGGAPYVISDSGRVVVRDEAIDGVCGYAICAFSLADPFTSAEEQPVSDNGTHGFDGFQLNAAGNRLFYVEQRGGRYRLVERAVRLT